MKSLFKAVCMLSVALAQLASAQGNFATIIGPDGRPINIPIEGDKLSTSKLITPETVARSKPEISMPSPVASNLKANAKATNQGKPASAQQDSQKVVTSDDFIDKDGIEYVDSELLIEKQFNLSDKKRFFPVPNQVGSVDYIERTDDQVADTLVLKATPQPLYRVADNYSVLPASALKSALPMECLTSKQLQKAEGFSKRGTKNLWPIQGNKDFEYELVKLSDADQIIYLQSYESKSPGTFYWPLSVFLDQQGCIIQGAASYLTEQVPSTWIQKSSLKGVLLAPEEAQYLLMTPMAQMPYSEEYSLSRSGSITLQTGTVVR